MNSKNKNELKIIFCIVNKNIFNSLLPEPLINIISTSRSYAHYVPFDIWNKKDRDKPIINIASGIFDKPFEYIVASLVHEMVHMYNDLILNIQDTSNGGVWHNKMFKREAEAHGLKVIKTKYGYSQKEASGCLLNLIFKHSEFKGINNMKKRNK